MAYGFDLRSPKLPPRPLQLIAQPIKDYERLLARHTFFSSRKYDGVRLRIDGDHVVTRTGVPVMLPVGLTSFARKLPLPLDAELIDVTTKRSYVVNVMRKLNMGDVKTLRIKVFDVIMPDAPFSDRMEFMKKHVPKHKRVDYKQYEIGDFVTLCQEARSNGHEGLVFRNANG
ncbi:MAG: hypothetical protein GY888_18440, partial [Planctomycetaceae bacterium]|nr:hypothetical protein [Planctomycetaceae bacterium]